MYLCVNRSKSSTQYCTYLHGYQRDLLDGHRRRPGCKPKLGDRDAQKCSPYCSNEGWIPIRILLSPAVLPILLHLVAPSLDNCFCFWCYLLPAILLLGRFEPGIACTDERIPLHTKQTSVGQDNLLQYRTSLLRAWWVGAWLVGGW